MEQTHSPLKGSTWQSTVSPSRGHDVLPAGHRAWSQVLTKLSGKEPATNRSVRKQVEEVVPSARRAKMRLKMSLAAHCLPSHHHPSWGRRGLLQEWFQSSDSSFIADDAPFYSPPLSLPWVLLIFIPRMELSCQKDDISPPARALLKDEF